MSDGQSELREEPNAGNEPSDGEVMATPGAAELKATVAANRAAKKRGSWWVTAIATLLFLAAVGAIGVAVYALWVPHPGEFGQPRLDTSDYVGTWELYKLDYYGPKNAGESFSAEEVAMMKEHGVDLDRVVIKADGTCKLALWGTLGEFDGTWKVDVLKENYLHALKRLPGLLRGERGAKTKVCVHAMCTIPNPERVVDSSFIVKKGKLVLIEGMLPDITIEKYFVRSK